MPITIRQPGEARPAIQAATAAGASRTAQRAAEIEAQKEAEFLRFAATKAQEVERTERVQQELEFRKQMRVLDYQAALEKEGRARAWETEKMEMRSRVDFEREERFRQRKLEEIDNARAAIKKKIDSGEIAAEQFESILFNLDMREAGVSGIGTLRQERPTKEDVLSPTQLLSAQKKIEKIEAEKPGWLRKILPKRFEGGPSEEELQIQEYLQGQVSRTLAQEIPTGTISTGLPEPKTQQEYDAIPSGSQYIDSNGNVRTKR